jgi:hypothetical protein
MIAEKRYLAGLDLGQTTDYSALVVLEQTQDTERGTPATYAALALRRWPLRTAYPVIVADMVQALDRAPLGPDGALIVDQTGVGRPVVDLFRQAGLGRRLTAVTITAGGTITDDGDEWHVPKKNLVGTVQVLLQSQRLKIAARIPEAARLTSELENFRMKFTAAANVQFEAWRDNDHDDMVLATALAAWAGETNVGGAVSVWFL